MDKIIITCAKCGTLNNVLKAKSTIAKCGNCKESLKFAGNPFNQESSSEPSSGGETFLSGCLGIYLIWIMVAIIFSLFTAPGMIFFVIILGVVIYFIVGNKNTSSNRSTATKSPPFEDMKTTTTTRKDYKAKVRKAHCWKCKQDLSSETHVNCDRCGWLRCGCGACRLDGCL